MASKPSDLITLSRLLDQALDLEPAEVEGWLSALPDEHAHLRLQLREMLEAHLSKSHPGFLAEGPRLPGAVDHTVAMPGEMIGPYRLIREIGRGGMGAVWLAERADGSYKRQVALKLPRLTWGTGLAERMARERDIGALLEHPNIARLYDAGVDALGRPYLALEYVDGQPLDAWCAAQALSIEDRLSLFVQVAKAVAYAHGRLVVHRDLKPSNVLVTSDGQAHLLDFGIAKLLHDAGTDDTKLTREQGRVLTPNYASPEQLRGDLITVASDVYSLGVLLYELLTGRYPHEPTRKSLAALEEAVLQGEAALASSRARDRKVAKVLNGDLDAILAKAIKREPQERYPTVDALAEDVGRYLSGDTVKAQPDRFGYRFSKAARRHWLGISASAAVLVAVLAGSGVAVLQAQRAARSAERERVVKAFVTDVFRMNTRADRRNEALRPTSTQALLEGGAQLIQQRFAGQPELQAELFGVVGGVFSDMGAYQLAADYSKQRLDTLLTLAADPKERAQALLSYGQALFDVYRFDEADARVTEILDLVGHGDSVYLDALVLRGRIGVASFNWEVAEKAIVEINEKLRDHGTDASRARAWTLAIQASNLGRKNQIPSALTLYRQAIDTALASEGPLSLSAIEIRRELALWAVFTGRLEDAQREQDALTRALRELGGAHRIKAALADAEFATEATVAGYLIKTKAAISMIRSGREEIVATNLPVPAKIIQQIDLCEAQILQMSGDLQAAARLLSSAQALFSDSEKKALDRYKFLSAMLTDAEETGRHMEADKRIQDLWKITEETGYVIGFYWIQNRKVENYIWSRRLTEAFRALDDADSSLEGLRGFKSTGAAKLRYLKELRAQALIKDEKPQAALRLLEQSPPAPDDGSNEKANYYTQLGEALCAVGRDADGLKVLNQSLAIEEQVGYYEGNHYLARIRSVAGVCALKLGKRDLAISFAKKARAAFTLQPGVSPHFKEPLLKLERALGMKAPAL